jgi:hypothetical protein
VSSLHPGIAKALPSLSASGMPEPQTPREWKAEGIRLQPLTGISKRKCARLYKMSWSAVYRWFNPRCLDDTPHPRFVRWLKVEADRRAFEFKSAELLAGSGR